MKSYTDLEQSRVLSGILPFESADMFYDLGESQLPNVIYGSHNDFKCYLPCWSLVALLSVLPEVSLNTFKDKEWNAMVQHDDKMIYGDKNNPVDACYELILKLHELNLL